MRRKILIIDDSAMLRRVATNILQAQPGRYEVLSSGRAAEGFALACLGGVELILVDHFLAGLADAQLCRRLLSDVRTSSVPVILMTGQGLDAPSLANLPANVVETIAKPFSPEQLTGMINGIFKLRSNRCELSELRAALHPEAGFLPLACQDLVADTPPVTEKVAGSLAPVLHRSWLPEAACTEHEDGESLLFSGDTASTSLRSVLHRAADAGESGVLRLWSESDQPTEVLFDGGRLLVVTTHDGERYSARAAESLPAKVSPATVDEAVSEQNSSGTPFLLTLGARGLLSKASAVALLGRFGLRQFASLWPQRALPAVRFEFCRLEVLPSYALRLASADLPLDQWMLESTRILRAEDLAANLRHEGSVGSPYFQADAAGILGGLELSASEQELLRLVDGRTDLPRLAVMLGATPESLYLQTFRFRCLDVLSYRTAPAAFVMTPRTSLRRVLPLQR